MCRADMDIASRIVLFFRSHCNVWRERDDGSHRRNNEQRAT